MLGVDAVKIQNIFTATLPCSAILSKREIVVFTYLDHLKQEQWAEASPLPGRSQETIQDVLDALNRFSKGISAPLPPSLQFALDTTLLPPFEKPLKICRLLSGTPQQILKIAERLYQEGATHVKVKVADIKIQESVALIKELKHFFRLRIDSNRSWGMEEAKVIMHNFSPEDPSIEFFEEPLRIPHELRNFPLPIALDESLAEKSIDHFLSFPMLRALVIKPSLLGGIAACEQWMSICQQRHLQYVWSSAFESGIGILQLARLAAQYPSSNSPPGFDSYSFLSQDLLATPLLLHGGTLTPPEQLVMRRNLLCSLPCPV